MLVFGPEEGPKCTEGESTEEGACWRELANKSELFFLDWAYDFEVTYNWSGDCLNGAANGSGTLSFGYVVAGRPSEFEETGEMVYGVKQGHRTQRRYAVSGDYAIPCVAEVHYVDGKKADGWWTHRCNDGYLFNVEFVEVCDHGQCEWE